MTTRTSATSGNWRADDADTWGLGLNNYPAAGEHVVIDTGHTVTLGESNDAGSIKLIGTLAGGGHTLTLNDGGDNEIFDHDGTITGTLNITITGTTNRLLDLAGSSGNVNNLTINASSTRFDLSGSGTHTVGGNLTITAGELDTTTNNKDLTVAGDASVTGTLTGNASAISMGSLTINSGGTYSATSGTTTITNKASSNFAFKNSGTFTHNSGTMQIGDGSTSTGGAHLMNTTYHNLIINRDENAPDGNTPWRPSSGSEVTIAGDLTVTKGRFYRNNSSDSLVVTGDVDIAANGQVGTDAASGSNTFGTLTVNSGGKYLATSGTTTITAANGAPVNGRAWYIHNGATFTHNNGLCKFTASSPQVEMVSSGQTSTPNPFYDVEQTAGTMQWKGEHTKVLNNATLRGSQFNGSTGNLTVLGICRFTASSFNASDTSTSNHNFFGTLVIESGATVDVSAIDITVGSLRNLGGTIQ